MKLLDPLMHTYAEILSQLERQGASWVRLDEPALVEDRSADDLAALRRVYQRLGRAGTGRDIVVSTYFGHVGAAMPVLVDLPIEGVGLDLCRGPEEPGVCSPMPGASAPRCSSPAWSTGATCGSTTSTPPSGCSSGSPTSPTRWSSPPRAPFCTSRSAWPRDGARRRGPPLAGLRRGEARRARHPRTGASQGRAVGGGGPRRQPGGPRRPAALAAGRTTPPSAGAASSRLDPRRSSTARARRRPAAAWACPPCPPPRSGRFPRPPSCAAARASWRAGQLDDGHYRRSLRAEIDRVVALQEEIGLDVLVHGEPERDDMVRYFAAQLAGFVLPQEGWVQSYGSRCVRPPVLFGDVARPPDDLEWARYAQSRTAKPVKGMLTGPITMLRWSFVRDDQPEAETAAQLGLGDTR